MNKKNVSPKTQQPAMVSPSLQHAGQMVVSLTNLLRDKMYCDVFLQVGSQADEVVREAVDESRGVWAHSAVLAAVSPYLYARCKRNLNESPIKVIYISDVNVETLRELVENIYSARALAVSVEKAKALLAAATSLEVREVRDAACACLQRALSADNALGIRTSAARHGCTFLAAAATHHIHENFDAVLEADELLALEAESLMELLDTNRLAATKERALDAVLRWIQRHPQDVNLKILLERVKNIYAVTSLVVTVEKAMELLVDATSLKVDDVRDMVCLKLQYSLSANNVLGIYTSAVKHNCPALAAAASKYIQKHFRHVIQSKELLELEPDLLNTLLNANRHAATTDDAFDAVLRWMQHHPQERRHHLVSLLRLVQLPTQQIQGNNEVDHKLQDVRSRDVERQDLQLPQTLQVMPTTDTRCRNVERQNLQLPQTIQVMPTTDCKQADAQSRHLEQREFQPPDTLLGMPSVNRNPLDTRLRDVERQNLQPPDTLLGMPTANREPRDVRPVDVERRDLQPPDTLLRKPTANSEPRDTRSRNPRPRDLERQDIKLPQKLAVLQTTERQSLDAWSRGVEPHNLQPLPTTNREPWGARLRNALSQDVERQDKQVPKTLLVMTATKRKTLDDWARGGEPGDF